MSEAYLVTIVEDHGTVVAPTVEKAIAFARSYFGDYRTDYRNQNRVELLYFEQIGDETYYHFAW